MTFMAMRVQHLVLPRGTIGTVSAVKGLEEDGGARGQFGWVKSEGWQLGWSDNGAGRAFTTWHIH